MIRLFVLVFTLFVAGCEPAPRTFGEGEFPNGLSKWGLLQVGRGELKVHADSTAYDLNTPLFSDYALKLRTVWTPEGATGLIDTDGNVHLPVGSVITKTFYYAVDATGMRNDPVQATQFADGGLDLNEVRLIETRLLVHLEDGWVGLPYIWNEAQTEASLEITGAILPITVSGLGEFNYVVPDFNQCQGCHVTDLEKNKLEPIGLKARHLNKSYDYLQQAENQLRALSHKHKLDGLQDIHQYPTNADWQDRFASLDHRARSYLDINCGHCHNPKGPADTSGMFLNIEEESLLALGVCKPPIAAGQGTGGFSYGIDPGKGQESILTFRMLSDDPGAMMPELGRSLVHKEGVRLISQWIDEMEGTCGSFRIATDSR